MPRRAPGAPPKPRGRPRKPLDLLSPRTKRWRNARDANHCAALAIIETPQAAKEPKKMGRPLIPWAKLSKESRRKRLFRARPADEHVQLQLPRVIT